MNISLLGPPGSGKGTLSRNLAARTGLEIFETGAHLREYARNNDPVLAEHLAGGGMAPSDLVMRILAEHTQGVDGLIMDGIPRNEEQALAFLDLWKQGKLKFDALIILEAPEALVSERLRARWTCEGCAQIYSTLTKPPAKPGDCDLCGAKLAQRSDDTPAGIRKRLDLYRQKTLPAAALLEGSGVRTLRIDASRSERDVAADLAVLFEKRAQEAPKAQRIGRRH